MATKAELQAQVQQQEKEIQSLKNLLARAERELNDKLLPEELPPAPVPHLVGYWMRHYRMPWEVFWCSDHLQWINELDSSFPYSMADNTCPACSKEKDYGEDGC
ncbi:antitoxin PHD [Pantoea coffeiphila]|uniref:Antitoxin PHD n=1 Tax=Pantoea coffeiphila TaxID=1465635 RepID=A0A2S9I899_9GAMM|nr:antitoxin PHD [Pantoea coffeiphila]PRD14020.1 antitoxin PHD [Pantoea coffeiphila]